MTTREALEAALVATPDDVVLHSAYSDRLIEEGDPRGEYIRLQLAAEDRNQPVDQLRRFEQAAFELRQQHERQWLGELWPFLQRPPSARSVAEPMEPNVTVTWRRGWIAGLRIGQLTDHLVSVIARHPFTRLLGTFSVETNSYLASDGHSNDVVDLNPITRSGRFANLKVFELGDPLHLIVADGFEAELAVRSMSRLESIRLCIDQFSESHLFGHEHPDLHTIDITYNNPRCRFYILGYNPGLPNLRRLSLDTIAITPLRGEFGSEREPITPGDLQSFFRTKYLNKLEYFAFRHAEFGDAGVEELLASGFIRRLRGLDLCRCNITDAGAEMLAAHPHVLRLEYLHLDNNLLSPIGVDALETVGVSVSPHQYFGPDAYDEFVDEDDPSDELDPSDESDPSNIDFGDEFEP